MNEEEAIEGEVPHEALFLVLPLLHLRDLLAISQVCRSLRRAVNDDVLPWLNLVVGEPLNRRIFDDVLIRVTSKAQGRLSTLALIGCNRISDAGLLSVVASNPFISKLHVPGCTGLTPDGIVAAVEVLSQQGRRLTSLQINGIYNLNPDHLQMLRPYLLIPSSSEDQDPDQFYHDFIYLSQPTYKKSSNRPMDVDICPKCNQVRMVFDCPREACRRRPQERECRGCYECIGRCVECGTCLTDDDEDEQQFDAACSDRLCSKCWLKLPKCNYCNRPYCRGHAREQISSPVGSAGFLCSSCYFHYVQQ
ncbi:hypothetical protein Droror1_Dr00019140 [Drosera rotundifolia]